MVNKKLVKTLFILLTIMMVALAGLEIKNYLDATNKRQIVKEIIEVGPYKLSVKETALEKEIKKELKIAIEAKDQNAILQQVSRYFVADYFTLNDKVSVNDIGGLQFVFTNNFKNFKTNAINSYYGDLPRFQEVYGEENLPAVESVTASKVKNYNIKDLNIKKKENSVAKKAFSVDVNWTYQENEKLDTSKIVNKAKIIFVQNQDGDYFIFSLKGVN